MFSPSRQRLALRLTLVVSAFTMGSIVDSPVFAQGGAVFGGRVNTNGYGSRGYYPYGGVYSGVDPGYNIYGNFGVYGYPGSGIEGGASNPGYDPGHGGYPSYGGYGIVNPMVRTAPPRRLLGIDEEPVTLADGTKAMKVGRVFPGSAAEKVGLQAGDVIRSVNGYLTEQRGNLAWIIANAAPKNELKLSVQAAKGGEPRAVTAVLP